jgi:anti-sigma B factor antagonist
MAANQPPIISQRMENGLIITVMAKELLEDAEITELENAIIRLLGQGAAMNIVLSFENVKFLSSAVLRVLIKVNTAVGQQKGKLRLCNIDPKIMEVFKITRLDKVFNIRKNVDEAVESLR